MLSAHMLGLGPSKAQNAREAAQQQKADLALTRGEVSDLFSDYLYGRATA